MTAKWSGQEGPRAGGGTRSESPSQSSVCPRLSSLGSSHAWSAVDQKGPRISVFFVKRSMKESLIYSSSQGRSLGSGKKPKARLQLRPDVEACQVCRTSPAPVTGAWGTWPGSGKWVHLETAEVRGLRRSWGFHTPPQKLSETDHVQGLCVSIDTCRGFSLTRSWWLRPLSCSAASCRHRRGRCRPRIRTYLCMHL